MPNSGVSTDELLVGCSPINEGVGAVQSQLALSTLGSIPLHAVLRCDLAKVVDDDLGALAGKQVLVGCDTNVLLAMGFESLVKRARDAIGTAARCWL